MQFPTASELYTDEVMAVSAHRMLANFVCPYETYGLSHIYNLFFENAVHRQTVAPCYKLQHDWVYGYGEPLSYTDTTFSGFRKRSHCGCRPRSIGLTSRKRRVSSPRIIEKVVHDDYHDNYTISHNRKKNKASFAKVSEVFDETS